MIRKLLASSLVASLPPSVVGATSIPSCSKVPTSLYWYNPSNRFDDFSLRILMYSRLIISATDIKRGITEVVVDAACLLTVCFPELLPSSPFGSTEEGKECRIRDLSSCSACIQGGEYVSLFKVEEILDAPEKSRANVTPKFLACHDS